MALLANTIPQRCTQSRPRRPRSARPCGAAPPPQSPLLGSVRGRVIVCVCVCVCVYVCANCRQCRGAESGIPRLIAMCQLWGMDEYARVDPRHRLSSVTNGATAPWWHARSTRPAPLSEFSACASRRLGSGWTHFTAAPRMRQESKRLHEGEREIGVPRHPRKSCAGPLRS